MNTTPRKPAQPAPPAPAPEDVDFAEEAAPKESEFKTEKDAKALTSGGFDPIP